MANLGGSITYSFDTPVTSSGTTYDCSAGCSGTASVTGATTFSATFFGFSVSVTPSDSTVLRGGMVTYTVTVTQTGGTTEPVTLSVASSLQSGATATFTTNPVTTTGTSTLSVSTSSSGGLGDYTLTVQGQFNGLIETGTAKLHVYDFSVGLSPSDQTVSSGTPAIFALTLTLVPGSSTTGVPAVGLTVSGLPSDATSSLSPSSVTPTLAGAAASVTVTVSSPVTQVFTFKVTSTAPGASGGSRSSSSANLYIFGSLPPSTAGGVYMPLGATFTDAYGNTWVAPSGNLGGATWSSLLLRRSRVQHPAAHVAGLGRGIWDLRRAAGLDSHVLLLAVIGPPRSSRP